MTTQPTNHRNDAEQSLAQAIAALGGHEDPAELAIIGILQTLLAGPANRCQSCGVERPVIHDSWCPINPEAAAAAHDDTVEQKLFGLDHIDDHGAGVGSVGEIASRFGSGYTPAPWGAA